MSTAITGIDHVVIAVRDLDAAATAFRRLGFALTPRGRHPRFGTANHCAMFAARNYLELMTVAEPAAPDDLFRRCLSGRTGPVAIGWQTRDARAVGRDWAAAGLLPGEAIDFVRPVDTETGRQDAWFSVVALAPDRLPGLMGFVCQHDTPDLVWRPGSTEHPNGARGIIGLVGIADEPTGLADAYEGALDAERVVVDEQGLLVETGTAPIRFTTPAQFEEASGVTPDPLLRAPAIAGIVIAVESVDWVKQLLDAGAVPYVDSVKGVAVLPSHGCGAVIEFAEA